MTKRETVVFINGNSAAVRLVGRCRLPKGTRVRQYRDGNRIVIEPIGGAWPESFLQALGAWDEEIPRSQETGQRDPFA